jgi:uncharacterized lipoprotein
MKKIGVILFVVLILSGCSASWHIDRALKIDPDILETTYDTTLEVNVSFKDTTVFLEQAVKVEWISDTGHVQTDTVYECEDIPPIKAFSKDSSAMAEAWVKDGRLNQKVWAKKDTVLILRDTATITVEMYDSLMTVVQENTYTKKEKQSLLDWIKNGLALIGIILVIVLTIKALIKKP